MVTIDTSAMAIDGVTLVTVRLAGDGVAREVRVEQRLDGPVWPPRQAGYPESGWDETGYEGIVPADGVLALGYATPAPPNSDPVAVQEGPAVPDEAATTGMDDAPSVLQHLGDPTPPRGAVPPSTDATGPDRPDRPTDDAWTQRAQPADDGAPVTDSGATSACDERSSTVPAIPAEREVTAWLDRIEDRLATVERLAAVETVPDATAAIESMGGLAESERAVRAIEADRRRLYSVADRVTTLAARIESDDVPLATLERFR